jgi:endonuclease/exonuclease/phosphatase family metal-dependent hydrolase
MLKRILLRSAKVLLLCLVIACVGMAWVFHVHERHFPWPDPTSSISEAEWQRAATELAKPETQLKVLTWNIQMLPALLGPFSASLRKLQYVRAPWIVEYLNGQDCDVICLQEVFDQKAFGILKQGLQQKYPYMVFPQYASPFRALSNGVLFVSRVPIRYVDYAAYPGLRRIEWWTSKGCTLIEGVKDGLHFQMAGTHFPTGRQTGKDAAVAAIHDRLLPERKSHVPFIALGDFNTNKGSPEYDRLLSALEVHDGTIDDPRPYTNDPDNTWKRGEGKTLKLIDHVLLNPNGTETAFVSLHVQRARHEYMGAPLDLSDHFGLASVIILKP